MTRYVVISRALLRERLVTGKGDSLYNTVLRLERGNSPGEGAGISVTLPGRSANAHIPGGRRDLLRYRFVELPPMCERSPYGALERSNRLFRCGVDDASGRWRMF